jgi:hypothetical protein
MQPSLDGPFQDVFEQSKAAIGPWWDARYLDVTGRL